jgi:hypothetical protein
MGDGMGVGWGRAVGPAPPEASSESACGKRGPAIATACKRGWGCLRWRRGRLGCDDSEEVSLAEILQSWPLEDRPRQADDALQTKRNRSGGAFLSGGWGDSEPAAGALCAGLQGRGGEVAHCGLLALLGEKIALVDV